MRFSYLINVENEKRKRRKRLLGDVGFNIDMQDMEDINMNRIPGLLCSASLAHHGLLSSVRKMTLCDVNLSPVPAQHLASLASCVTSDLHIQNVSGCNLVSILTSVKCKRLGIYSLGREETKALVQAMESGVEEVMLGGRVTLDIEALTEYSGQGVCREVELRGDRYREEMRTWAKTRSWIVIKDYSDSYKVFHICR